MSIYELFLVPMIAWDLASRRKLHEVTLWGGLAFVVYGFLAPAIVSSPWWLELGRGMVTR